jgi:hypothetical protein
MKTIHIPSVRGEGLADRVFALVTMIGVVGGAVVGSALGAGTGTAFPIVWGTLGAMIGGGLAAGGWGLVSRLWTALFTRDEIRLEHETVRSQAFTPTSSAA